MKNIAVFLFAALTATSAFAAAASAAGAGAGAGAGGDWVPVGKSESETVYLQRTAATIYANGERHALVKSEFVNPREVSGNFFKTMMAQVVFDCDRNQSKITQTDFLDGDGKVVYSDPQPDATFAPIAADSETAFIQGFVCVNKKQSPAK